MENAPHSEPFWQMFRSRPAAFAHADRVIYSFNGLIPTELAARLLEEERFRDRLSALLTERYGLIENTGDQFSLVSQRLAAASSTELMNFVRQFGAVYWARAIVSTIESKAIAGLKEVIGGEAYAAALAHRDLAGSARVRPANENFDTVVTSAGFCCLAAWCGKQPTGLAQRIRLKLPASAELDGPVVSPFDELGPPIVERIAA